MNSKAEFEKAKTENIDLATDENKQYNLRCTKCKANKKQVAYQ